MSYSSIKNEVPSEKYYELVQEDAIKAYKEINESFNGFDWSDRRSYGDWLAQTYYYVCHVTRALGFACSKCTQDQDGIFRALLTGIKEELGHEKIALSDLNAMGYEINDFPEYLETMNYRQSFYGMIENYGPYAMPGFALPLEGIGPNCWSLIIKDLERAHGAKSIKFIKLHSELDVEHFGEGLKALEKMSFEQLKVVHKSLLLSTKLYIDIIKQIKLNAQKSVDLGERQTPMHLN